MSRSITFDTSIYINAFRCGDIDILLKRQKDGNPLWLSAVVLEELYAGASDRSIFKAVSHMERGFSNVNRLLVPNDTDWSITGQILNKIGSKYGFDKIGKSRLTNDTLLATSAARTGLKLLTSNKKDFQLISEFREFDWEVV